VPQFISDAMTQSGWREKTREAHETALALMVEILGDPAISSVGHDHATRIVAALKLTPKNRTQSGLAGVPIGELCERARQGELAPIADTTVRNHLLKISPFWKWAVRRDLTAKDWFSGALRERKKRRDKDERPPFTVDELRRTFPTFRTVRGVFRWFPVVALYSALRAGEIAQLTVADCVFRRNVTADAEKV
jgi:integrase